MDSTNYFSKKQVIIVPLRQNYHLWIPLLVGLVFRLNGIVRNSIWYDEALTIYLTRQPLTKMINLLTAELNPPLWEILEWLPARLIPIPEIGYRLLSLLSSLAILIVAQRLFAFFEVDRHRQFLGLSLLAISPYQIWMAQDARVYALMSFLYLLSFLFLIQQKWWGLTACCGMLLYSNSAAVFYVASLLAVGFILHFNKRTTILKVGFTALALYSPWLLGGFINNLSGQYFSGYNIPPVNAQRMIEQLNHIFLIGVTSIPPIGELLKFLNTFIVLFFLLILVVINTPKMLKSIEPNHLGILALLILSILPLILIIIVAWIYQNGHVILYRSFSPLAVALITLIALSSKTNLRVSTTFLVILILISMTYSIIWSPQEKGGYLKEIIQDIPIPNKPDTIVFHATATSLLPFEYYLNNTTHYLLDAHLPMGFLAEPLQAGFGIKKISYQHIPSDSYWVVWAKDDHLPPFVSRIMNTIVHEEQLIRKIDYPQMAPLYIYYVSQTNSSADHP